MTRILVLALAGFVAGVCFGMDDHERKRKFAGVDPLVKKLAKISFEEVDENSGALDMETLDSDTEAETVESETKGAYEDGVLVFLTATGSKITLASCLLKQPGYGFFHSLYKAQPDPRMPIFLPISGWAAEFFVDVFATGRVHFDGMEEYKIRYLLAYANKYMVQSVIGAACINLKEFSSKLEEARMKAEHYGVREPIFLSLDPLGWPFPLLFYGIEVGDLRYVEMAMKMGASIEDTHIIKNEEVTAYNFAGRKYNVDAVKYFVSEHKADVNAAIFPIDGLSVPMLAYAVEENDIELARFALQAGADVNAVFQRGSSHLTALTHARELENLEMVPLLLEYGAEDSIGEDLVMVEETKSE